MQIRSIRVPLEERKRFQVRAASFFPREMEDFLIGEVRRGGIDVHMILPTRTDDVYEHGTAGVELKQIAMRRALDTARSLGLSVVGSVHTHPWRIWNPRGLLLSRSDHAAFAWYEANGIEPAVMGVCAIYHVGRTPDRFSSSFAFWLRDRSLRLTLKTVPSFTISETLSVLR